MLLTDIGKSPNTTFRKINQHLATNYGFKITEDISDKDLVAIMEQVQDEITELKIKGDDSKSSPEISKRLLVLEGLQNLREFAMANFQSPDLDHVVKSLSEFVHDAFRISGTTHEDFEECVRDGMKHYRSSKYRFPDDMIEQRVRDVAMSRLNGPVIPMQQDGRDGQVDEAQPILGEEEISEFIYPGQVVSGEDDEDDRAEQAELDNYNIDHPNSKNNTPDSWDTLPGNNRRPTPPKPKGDFRPDTLKPELKRKKVSDWE